MQFVTIGLFVVLLAAVGILLRRLGAQRELLSILQQDQVALADAWKVQQTDTAQLPASGKAPLISIEILNPIELAAKESNFAGPISTVAPNMIRRMVYQRTAAILRQELSQKGVQAEVRLNGLA